MIDITPILDIGVELLSVVLMILGSWAIAKFTKKVGLENDQVIRDYLDNTLKLAVQYGKTKVKGQALTIETENEILAHAANYAIAQIPQALAHFNIDNASLERLLKARLGIPMEANVVIPPGDTPS